MPELMNHPFVRPHGDPAVTSFLDCRGQRQLPALELPC